MADDATPETGLPPAAAAAGDDQGGEAAATDFDRGAVDAVLDAVTEGLDAVDRELAELDDMG